MWSVAPDTQPDETYGVAETPETIDGFLNRPLLISTISWPVQTALNVSINPWTLFFENDQVFRRMVNFKLLRAKLHVRFLVNGNQFYYGRALISYRPLHNYDFSYRYNPVSDADIVEMSQRPSVMLDPTDSTGASMDLPFFWMNNALNIPSKDWREMGTLDVVDMVTLRHSNSSTDAVTVSVYAWATDVVLSQPTSVAPEQFVNQSEFDAPISGPASKIARAASKLKSAPVIGPYAKATELAANVVGGVARVFGFSKPPITDDAMITIQRPQQYTNTANVKSAAMPLSLDVKKEVTVDPRTVGLSSDDELSIKHLAQKKSYVTAFDWDPSDGSGKLLYNLRVNPMLNKTDETGATHMIPAGFASVPFHYWRGTMCFTFSVVASQYHKGRLRIVYDPEVQDTDETNVNRQIVVDIANTQKVEVCVGWGQATTYLKVPSLLSDEYHGNSRFVFPNSHSNGVLSIYVLNELTTPADQIDPISVIVHASMLDDFEVAGPTNDGLSQLELDTLTQPSPPGLPLRNLPGYSALVLGPNDHVYQTGSDGLAESGSPSFLSSHVLHMVDLETGITDSSATATFQLPIEKAENETSFKQMTATYTLRNDQNPTAATFTLTLGGDSRVEVVQAGGVKKITLADSFDMASLPTGISIISTTAQIDTSGAVRAWCLLDSYTTYMDTRYEFRTITAADSDLWDFSGSMAISDNNWSIGKNAIVNFMPEHPVPAWSTFRYEHKTGINAAACEVALDGGVFVYDPDSAATNSTWRTKPVPQTTLMSDTYWETTSNSATRLARVSYFHDKANIVNQAEEEKDELHADTVVSEQVGSPRLPADPNIIFFGEEIPSLRTMLKRPNVFLWYVRTTNESFTRIPVTGPFADPEENFLGLPLLEFVRRAYLGERGGVRISVTTPWCTTQGAPNAGLISMRRLPEYTGYTKDSFPAASSPYYSNEGVICATHESLPEADVPWYSMYRFQPTRYGDYVNNDVFYLERQAVAVEVYGVRNELYLNKSICEDYNLYFFLNCPIVRPRV